MRKKGPGPKAAQRIERLAESGDGLMQMPESFFTDRRFKPAFNKDQYKDYVEGRIDANGDKKGTPRGR